MGLSIENPNFSADDYAAFTNRLHDCLSTLKGMLDDPDFGGGTKHSWGAELELYLINSEGMVTHANQEILQAANNPQLSLELNRFNLEYNSLPVFEPKRPLSILDKELTQALSDIDKIAKPLGAYQSAIGILPTLSQDDFGFDSMTMLPRYLALTEGLKRIGTGDFRIHINGTPPLKMQVDDVTLEGANTSFQIHYRVSPQHFTNLYNGLLLATPIVLGLACNSPTLFGHKLWQETRIPLFKHSIDSRHSNTEWRQPARVSFGQGFVRQSAFELFAEAVAMHPPLLPVCGTEDYQQQWQQGIAPGLDELRMQQNSIWSWLRPVYDTADGGHLRLELRVLPAGPTVKDMLANAAFYIGLGEALAERIDDFLPGMPFKYAKYNFYRSAQFGMNARLVWPNDHHGFEERTLAELAQTLLPLAKQGLAIAEIDPQEGNHYLSIIEERIQEQLNGAQWQLNQLEKLSGQWPAPQAALQDMFKGYLQNQYTGKPVAQWSKLCA